MINQYDSLTQFHSVTRVDLNSKLAKAKSAFSGHETTTLKNDDDEININVSMTIIRIEIVMKIKITW